MVLSPCYDVFPEIDNGKVVEPDPTNDIQSRTVEELKLREAKKATELFDCVAEQVAEFIKDKKIAHRLPLGFTFSFPTENFSLISGKLLRWTKEFNAKDAIGKDPVQLLNEAFKRKKVSIHLLLVIYM